MRAAPFDSPTVRGELRRLLNKLPGVEIAKNEVYRWPRFPISALDKSIARGDEQLSYYVAQAREVVDLSLMSQKQIIENLQQLAVQRAAASAETA